MTVNLQSLAPTLTEIVTNSSSNNTNCLEFDPDGLQYIKWIYIVFGECVHSAREQASFYVGLASLLFWMCAIFPQIYANFKNKDATSLSLGFLLQAFISDSSNFISCILSRQLTTQIIVALYFVSTDIIVLFQYFYYLVVKKYLLKWSEQRKKRGNQQLSINDNEEHLYHHEEDDIHHDNHQVTLLNPNVTKTIPSPTKLNIKVGYALILVLLVIMISFRFKIWNLQQETFSPNSKSNDESMVYPQRIYTTSSTHIGRKLFSTEMNVMETQSISKTSNSSSREEDWAKHDAFVFPPNTPMSIVGYTIGWLCALLYLGSRPPQIYKNFKRGSAEGVSRIFFSLAVLGNSSYVASIWLFSFNGNYLMMRLPFLLETSVNVCMDSFILFQIVYYYRKNLKKDKDNLHKHEQGNDHVNSIELEIHEHGEMPESVDSKSSITK
ncbi:hypothetical protein C9374_010592 [Naegleria lovaniensis]|uniref:Uncharacterized protein n=1 Tax=Naegleria lovaniensis TaxID=51637 RepID=A0AA88GG58_NAELO|nr:uncharacterized protein C9374_010592 [Naegleria lovaniensis]KAG2374573.1 hypothetical protein C9374_010592 [Naegleria lovaniensis]